MADNKPSGRPTGGRPTGRPQSKPTASGTVHLHVLNRPEDGVLKLAFPANGRRFTSAHCGEHILPLDETAEGYEMVLPIDSDGVDTVIRLS